MRFDAAPVEDAPAPPPALALPDPPRALTARRVAPAAVELAWRRGDASQSARGLDRVESASAPPMRFGITLFELEMTREGDANAAFELVYAGSVPAARLEGVPVDARCAFRVRETSVAGAGPWSPEVVETVENVHPPEKTETRRRDDPSTGSSGKRSDVQPPETVRRSDVQPPDATPATLHPATPARLPARSPDPGVANPPAPARTPSAPAACIVTAVDARSARLEWAPPADGGSPIVEYVVERADLGPARASSLSRHSCAPADASRRKREAGDDETAAGDDETAAGDDETAAGDGDDTHGRRDKGKGVAHSDDSRDGCAFDDQSSSRSRSSASGASGASDTSGSEDSEDSGRSSPDAHLSFVTKKVRFEEDSTRVATCRATIRGLAPRRAYAFRVSAVNAAGRSRPSSASRAETDAAPPAAPAPPRAASRRRDAVEFAWRAPEEEEACFDDDKGDGDGFIFFDDDDGDGDGHICRRLARRSRAVPREKAVPSTPLVYVLEARRVPTRGTASIASKAGAGSGASFVSSPSPSPKKKKKKRASSDDDSDAAGWIVVYRGFDARATVSGLDPGETIRARVRAGNDVGFGPPSEPRAFRTLAAPPDPPEALSFSRITPESAKVRWRPPTRRNGSVVRGYVVQHREMTRGARNKNGDGGRKNEKNDAVVSDSPGDWTTVYESLDASVAHFRATGLRPGAAHEFRVAALADADVANAADASADRSRIRFGASNFAVTPRRPPHSPAAPRAAKIAQTSILVAWDAAANDEEGRETTTGYVLEVSGDRVDDVDADPTAFRARYECVWTGTGEPRFELTGVRPGQSVRARIRALGSDGGSTVGAVATLRTSPPPFGSEPGYEAVAAPTQSLEAVTAPTPSLDSTSNAASARGGFHRRRVPSDISRAEGSIVAAVPGTRPAGMRGRARRRGERMRKRDLALRVVLACVAAFLAWMVVNAPSLYASAPRGR